MGVVCLFVVSMIELKIVSLSRDIGVVDEHLLLLLFDSH
jgi:hypothetical protein